MKIDKTYAIAFSIPALMIITSFGPYVFLSLGLRTEQLFIYMLLPFACMKFIFSPKTLKISTKVAILLFLMIFVTIWTFVVTIAGEKYYTSVFDLLANIENYFQPIAILLILHCFGRVSNTFDQRKILLDLINVFLFFLFLNFLLQVLLLFFDIDHVMRYFWRGTEERFGSIANRALALGRTCGVFNQPMEAGLTYSLALFAFTYKIKLSGVLRTIDLCLLLCLIFAGLLTISKVFLFGGLFLFVTYYLYSFKLIRSLSFLNTATLIVFSIAGIQILANWRGIDYFLRFFLMPSTSGVDGIKLVSAGRFSLSEPTIMQETIKWVLNESPVYGFGFASAEIVDSAYVQYLVQGGLIALSFYLLLLLYIGGISFIYFLNYASEESVFLLVIFIFLLFSSIGAPTITINRFSTIFWVILFFLLQNLYKKDWYSVLRQTQQQGYCPQIVPLISIHLDRVRRRNRFIKQL